MIMIRLLTIASLVLLGGASIGCGDDTSATDGGNAIDAGGGDPTVCNFLTCEGCCDGNVCNKDASKSKCGLNGRACQICEGADECFSGSCAPPTTTCDGCTGCCLGGSQCLAGDDQAACGTGNGACESCPAGQGCEGGACVAVECNATTCATGCCTANGQCVQTGEQSLASCGKGGNACEVCDTDSLSCTSGTCVIDQACLDFCSDGCCTAQGQCLLYANQNPTSCGLAGQCSACTGTDSCVDGTCGPDQAWVITVKSAIIASLDENGAEWDFFGNSDPDPFVAGALTDDLIVDWTTTTILNTFTPNWDEEVGAYLESDLLAQGLEFNVNDNDNLPVFEIMGNCVMTLTLGDLNAGTKTLANCGPLVTNLVIEFAKQ
jgi:hypothetical protein